MQQLYAYPPTYCSHSSSSSSSSGMFFILPSLSASSKQSHCCSIYVKKYVTGLIADELR